MVKFNNAKEEIIEGVKGTVGGGTKGEAEKDRGRRGGGEGRESVRVREEEGRRERKRGRRECEVAERAERHVSYSGTSESRRDREVDPWQTTRDYNGLPNNTAEWMTVERNYTLSLSRCVSSQHSSTRTAVCQ